jgi:hypothetical protein
MLLPKDSLVLLLTATINPGGTPFVARADPTVRLRDYQQALTAWLRSESLRKIVFYENSGFDIGSLREIAQHFPRQEVEFHSFLGNDTGVSKGKGYPELLGIERVLAESDLIKDCRYIVKCTGRLTVGNAARLFERIDDDGFDIMCTLVRNFTFADSRLFIATPDFVSRYLIPQKCVIDDNKGIFLEHALAYATARGLSEQLRWLPFPILPDICGISGTSGVSHSLGLRRRVQEAIYYRVRRYLNAR